MSFMKKLIYRLRGEYTTEQLINRGMRVGTNFLRLNGVILDPDHCWHITIGDDVTLAPRVHVLCHDASTKHYLNYTKIGNVKIGNRVFVGAESVILPGVMIGDDVIIGANSTITHDIPSNSVAVGSPARIVGTTEDYIKKECTRMESSLCFGAEYTLRQNVSMEKRQEIREQIDGKIGYID